MTSVKDIDRQLLFQWRKAYEIEALAAIDNQNLDTLVESFIKKVLKNEDYWVLFVDDNPVCLSGFSVALSDIVQIGGVWTPPDHRCKGYARTLLALTLVKARERGIEKAILFTDSAAAAKAYEAVGFQHIGYYRLAILKQPIMLNSANPTLNAR